MDIFAFGMVVSIFAAAMGASKLKAFPWIGAVLPIIVFATYAVTVFVPFVSIRQAMAAGKCQYVSGVVENFVGEPAQGRGTTKESYTVSGTKFEYSQFELRPGYHRTVSSGGEELGGRFVRICVINGEIAGLVVRR